MSTTVILFPHHFGARFEIGEVLEVHLRQMAQEFKKENYQSLISRVLVREQKKAVCTEIELSPELEPLELFRPAVDKSLLSSVRGVSAEFVYEFSPSYEEVFFYAFLTVEEQDEQSPMSSKTETIRGSLGYIFESGRLLFKYDDEEGRPERWLELIEEENPPYPTHRFWKAVGDEGEVFTFRV